METNVILSKEAIYDLFRLPFFDLVTQAHAKHEQHQPKHHIQLSVLLNIKAGACSEDCGYCSQSGHYQTGLAKEKLMSVDAVIQAATAAKAAGATRYCLGAAWRQPPKKALPQLVEMIKAVKALDLEVCVTLGMLDAETVSVLEEAGLDFYNHNLDTSRHHYPDIVSTHTYDDRLNTLALLAQSQIKICCGGILAMGETLEDRVALIYELTQLEKLPESIPMNRLIRMKGTPMEKISSDLDDFDFVRTIAVTRLACPSARIRLSAGRLNMSDALQAWCFYVGANSIHTGEGLLTSALPGHASDRDLLARLDLQPML